MYKDINSYIPFTHESLESKNQLINFARTKDKNKVEEILAATIIYTNLIDYLSQNLLENLRRMCSVLSYKNFGAVFYYDPSCKKTNISLGNVINELRDFGFPDKDGFLKELTVFSETRNRIMHELMKLDLKATTKEFDKDLNSISVGAEEILTKFNSITAGIAVVWQKIYPVTLDKQN